MIWEGDPFSKSQIVRIGFFALIGKNILDRLEIGCETTICLQHSMIFRDEFNCQTFVSNNCILEPFIVEK